MNSVGLLKLPDTRTTSRYHYVKDRLVMRLEYDEKKVLCGSKNLKR